MNRDRILQGLWAAALGFCLSAGSLGCMISGLHLMSGAQVLGVLLWCGVFSLAAAGISLLKLSGFAWLLMAGVLVLRWLYGPMEASVERLVYEITRIYHSGYGWPVISWLEEPGQGSLMPVMRALAMVISASVCYGVNRRGSRWVILPASVLPVVSTLLLTDTVPKAGYLFAYFFGLILLLVTQGVRRRDVRQGNILCLRSAAPVAIVLALVFLLNPQTGYDKQDYADKLDNMVSSLLQRFTEPDTEPPIPSGGNIHLPTSGDTADMVNLNNVGPKSRQTQWVMTVESSQTGTLYLRGASFASYDGTTWRTGQQPLDREEWPQFSSQETRQTVAITTRNLHSVMYLPYYSTHLESLNEGRYRNQNDVKTYEIAYYPSTAQPLTGSAALSVSDQYLQLTPSTNQWAQPAVMRILGSSQLTEDPQSYYQAARKIGEYVRRSGEYSLQTPRIPEGTEDFVRWFLEESDTGYCVHFASSAVVLLRAAGIPARYVTGYVASVKAGQQVQVLMANAHAWAEYYVPGLGWLVLEATPASSQAPEIPSQPPLITEPTTPGTTRPGQTASTPPEDPENTDPENTAISPGDDRPTSGPDDSDPTQEGPPPVQKRPRNLGWLWWCLGILAAIFAQWQLRLRLRQQWLHTGRGNRRGLVYWREVEHLARLLQEEPPKELLALAQKAKFSQHTLNREELMQLSSYLRQAQSRLQKKPWYCQLVYRLVYALY